MGSRILALDLGERRIGLALSDPEGILASGRGVYRRRNLEEDLGYLERLIGEEGVEEIVLGLPRNMDGSLGEQAERALKFKRLLEERLGLPVRLFDERLTSAEAERVLIEADLSRRRRREVRDELAAVLILQGYLEYSAQARRER
ncbi:MAG: Holliday junction resolvase RuvX [Candidatus Bipolaricaulia bacterium]